MPDDGAALPRVGPGVPCDAVGLLAAEGVPWAWGEPVPVTPGVPSVLAGSLEIAPGSLPKVDGSYSASSPCEELFLLLRPAVIVAFLLAEGVAVRVPVEDAGRPDRREEGL